MTAAADAPLFRKLDCLQIPVPDLDAGLAFYRDRLGHELLWRTATQAGLSLPDTDAELVLQTEQPRPEVNLLVSSVAAAVEAIVAAGGHVVVPPFAIRSGQCAVVHDPWGNHWPLGSHAGVVMPDEDLMRGDCRISAHLIGEAVVLMQVKGNVLAGWRHAINLLMSCVPSP